MPITVREHARRPVPGYQRRESETSQTELRCARSVKEGGGGKIINRSLSLSSAPVRFSHHFLLHDCTAILELGPDYAIGRGKGQPKTNNPRSIYQNSNLAPRF